MEEGSSPGKMERCMKVNSKMIKGMGREPSDGRMGKYIRVLGKAESSMERESS